MHPKLKDMWTIVTRGIAGKQFFRHALILIAFTLTTVFIINLISQRFQQISRETLDVILDGSDRALHVWARDQKLTAQNIAKSQDVILATKLLLQEFSKPESLLASDGQELLRKQFKRYIGSGQYLDFFIIGPGNISLASSRNANIGTPNLLTRQPDVLAKLWKGEPTLSRVQLSKVPIQKYDPQYRYETMFVGAPIRNTFGNIVALLTLHIDPNETLFPLLKANRIGETGETYIFDRNGLMLSKSRFESQLQELGLIRTTQHPKLMDSSKPHFSHNQISVTDPGVDLRTNKNAAIPQKDRPLTLMAASATRGERDSNVDGYRDYRGVPVIGAWLWVGDLNFGIAVEQDQAEAYALFHFIRNLICISSGITFLLIVGLSFVFAAERQKLYELQNRLKAIVDTAEDGITSIDKKGRIQSVNPAFEMMFGYASVELLQKNIKMLMLEPHAGEHNSYLERYIQSGNKSARWTGREFKVKRADGSIFPIELSISRLDLASGLSFTGIIRDVSERKKSEERLKQEKAFNRHVVDALQAHIAVLDHTGCIVFINKAWTDFAQDNGLFKNFTWLGLNYLKVAEESQGENAVEAPAVTAALNKMLAGGLDSYTLEYPCHSPDKKRWFEMRANRFIHQGENAVVISHLNITTRVEAEKQLEIEKNTAEISNRILSLSSSALDRAGVAEYWVSQDVGKILRVSDYACKHTGYSRKELLNMRVADFDISFSADNFAQKMLPIKEKGWGRFESIHQTRDGRRVPVEITTMHNPADSKQSGFFIAFVVDITERKEIEAELILAREGAEEASRIKSMFLANMSHEIRTPMNAIIGMSHLLMNTQLAPKQQEYLGKIDTSAKSLLGIINDILDFSKIEADRLEMESTEFVLENVLEQLINTLLIKIGPKDVEIFVKTDPVVPYSLIGDPLRLGQILLNLATNAVKFTEQGEIVIATELVKIFDSKAKLRFSVSDTGIGMTAEQISRLFQAFSQADASTTRKYGGTGLGLSISKRLIELMGGKINVTSEVNKGSTFHFTANFGLPSIKLGDRIWETGDLKGMKILVVDDSVTSQGIMREMLQSMSFGVSTADTGEEGLRELDRAHASGQPYGLVIMDWKMPGWDGIETSLRIKQNTTLTVSPKIIMLTAYGREEIMQKAEQAGLDGFLIKPVSASLMFNTIMEVFGQKVNQHIRKKRRSTPDQATLEKIQGTRILLVEDNDINQEVASGILEGMGFAVSVADNGIEAVRRIVNSNVRTFSGKSLRAENTPFDLILMDIQMPVMDGLEATRRIREWESRGTRSEIRVDEDKKHPETRDLQRATRVPIIAMTAHAMTGDREKSIDAGMDDHVTKPIDPDELLSTIVRWIEPGIPGPPPLSEPQMRKTSEKVDSVDAEITLPELPGIDIDDGVYRVGGNRGIFKKLLIKFSVNQGDAIEKIESALASDDTKTAVRLVHTLKGVSGNIGARKLYASARELEAVLEEGLADVKAKLADLSEKLGTVLSGIAALKPVQSADMNERTATGGIDIGNNDLLFEELERLLRENDTGALNKFDSLKIALRGYIADEEIMAMEKTLYEYEFEHALDKLKKIKKLTRQKG